MTHFTGLLFCQEKKRMKALTFLGAATCRGENVSAYNVSGFIIFLLTFSTTYDTKKKKKYIPLNYSTYKNKSQA
jgi:hypothetical protein